MLQAGYRICRRWKTLIANLGISGLDLRFWDQDRPMFTYRVHPNSESVDRVYKELLKMIGYVGGYADETITLKGVTCLSEKDLDLRLEKAKKKGWLSLTIKGRNQVPDLQMDLREQEALNIFEVASWHNRN